MSRITKTQLVNLTKQIDELTHKLNLIEKNETIILSMNSPGDRLGTRYTLVVRNSDLHTESAFLTERVCIGSQECYSMLYPIWLLLCKLTNKFQSAFILTEKDQTTMQSIYQHNEEIFLGDLSQYLPFLSDPKPKKALVNITEEIKDGSYLDNPDYIDNNYKWTD